MASALLPCVAAAQRHAGQAYRRQSSSAARARTHRSPRRRSNLRRPLGKRRRAWPAAEGQRDLHSADKLGAADNPSLTLMGHVNVIWQGDTLPRRYASLRRGAVPAMPSCVGLPDPYRCAGGSRRYWSWQVNPMLFALRPDPSPVCNFRWRVMSIWTVAWVSWPGRSTLCFVDRRPNLAL